MPFSERGQLGLRMLAGNRWNSNIGSSLAGAQLGMQEDQQRQAALLQEQQDAEMRRKLVQAQITKMGQPQAEEQVRPVIVMRPDGTLGYESPNKAVGMQAPAESAGGGGAGPASLQEWAAFQRMSPDDKKAFLDMKRQPTMPQVIDYQGGKAWADRVNQNVTPISSAHQEAEARGVLAAGQAAGTVRGEAAGAIDKKAINAEQTLGKLQLADPLIEIATGSSVGSGADKVAAFFGKSLDGAQAIAQLRILQADLMTTMPRMEGPQSDRDVELYRQAAGELGDPSVPRAQKKAALRTIRDIQNRYAAGGSVNAAPKAFNTVAEAEAAGLPPGTKITVGGRSATVQ